MTSEELQEIRGEVDALKLHLNGLLNGARNGRQIASRLLERIDELLARTAEEAQRNGSIERDRIAV